MKKGVLALLGVLLLGGAAVAYFVLPQHMLPRWIQRPRLVDNPAPNTPEFVVHEVIKACQEADEEKGWQIFRAQLHPDELGSPASEKNWRTLNYPSIRRKVRLFTPTDGQPAFELKYIEVVSDKDLGGNIKEKTKVFVTNEGNPENPTPCNLFKDGATGDAYKIQFGCL